MAEWCMEHPWMTFILLIVLFNGISMRYSRSCDCKRCWKKKNRCVEGDKSNENH